MLSKPHWHVVITRCKEKINQFNYETPSASSIKRKSDNNMSSSKEQKDPKNPTTSLNKASSSNRRCIFEIGPLAWIRKEINIYTIQNIFSLPLVFCEAIGLRETCAITLRTSESSNATWLARIRSYKNCNHLGGSGWKRFCWENGIKEGDVCTFNVVETKLWHVVITRCEEKIDQFCIQQESTKTKKDMLNSEGQKGPKVSMVPLNKASYRTYSVFKIGPPAWIKKEINTSTIEHHLSLPLSFCKALGLREPCTVTLKTPTSSTSSWHAAGAIHKSQSSGWIRLEEVLL
ncbi:hypothetical protein PVAP13_7KG172592 [Panicum virgatum]|uniref:TF-B3 domain-containing protein n=1 Tax=Panicum virgatum TaxID=38727 RepID=A0A8T0QKD6_PANVG|nr:hypothetical protein PVAP13_7KG172592 [Panicum virgatum]